MHIKNLLNFTILSLILNSTMALSSVLTVLEHDWIINVLNTKEISPEQRINIQKALEKKSKKKACEKGACPSTPSKKPKKEDTTPATSLFTPKKDKVSPNGGHFIISPEKQPGDKFKPEIRRYHTIYAHMLITNKDGEPLIKRNDRIDFLKILGKTKVTNKNLDEALLKIENKLRAWVHANHDVYYKTTYVGLAKTFRHRALSHRRDLRNYRKILSIGTKEESEEDSEELEEDADVEKEDDDEYAHRNGKKVLYTAKAADYLGADVRMSPLVYRVPEEWLPLVEVLVGTLLNTTQKAGTLLGNGDAIRRYDLYKASKVRNEGLKRRGLIEGLKKKDLLHLLGET